jgi:hypothetical protein
MILFVVADERARYNTCTDESHLLYISGKWGQWFSEVGISSYIQNLEGVLDGMARIFHR